jgi:hypothetical protein
MEEELYKINNCLNNIKYKKNWEQNYLCCIFKYQQLISNTMLDNFFNKNNKNKDFYINCLYNNKNINKKILDKYNN